MGIFNSKIDIFNNKKGIKTSKDHQKEIEERLAAWSKVPTLTKAMDLGNQGSVTYGDFLPPYATVPTDGEKPEIYDINSYFRGRLGGESHKEAKARAAEVAGSYGFVPENLLKLVRLTMPSVTRNKIFTETAMSTASDSVKYIRPVFSNKPKLD